VAKGKTSFRLGLIVAYFCVLLLFVSCDRRGEGKTSFRTGLIFAIFLLLEGLILSGVTGVARAKPRSELA
jgi:FtsH-binding integral membrane protein